MPTSFFLTPRIVCHLTLAFALIVSAAWAQSPPAASQPQSPAVHRMLNGVPLTYLHGIGRELADELRLNDSQIETVATIVDRRQQRISEDRRKIRMLRAAQRELSEAQRDGEADKAAQIERRIGELEAERAAAGGAGVADGQTAFFDEVRKALPASHTPGIDAFETRLRDRRQLGERLRVAIEELPNRLELNADQLRRFEALRAELRAAAPKSNWTAAQPTAQEVEWLDAGLAADPDDPTSYGPVRTPQAPNLAIERFFDELSTALDPAQRDKLITLRASASVHGEPAFVDMRAFFRAVHRLTLSEDQQTKIRDIERSAMREHRRAAGDADARQSLARAAREQVRALLTAEQIGELDRLMSEGHAERPTSRPAAEPKP